MENPQIRLHR